MCKGAHPFNLLDFLRSIDPHFLAMDGYQQVIDVSRVIIFAHIHCLPSYAILFDFLIDEVGINASDIFIVPKSYSTITSTIDEFTISGINVIMPDGDLMVGHYDRYTSTALHKACNIAGSHISHIKCKERSRVILLDDGGLLTEHWFRNHELATSIQAVSIQQTASGIHRRPHSLQVTKINVAGSAAKRWFESRIIADGVKRKLQSISESVKGKNVGIVGYGPIGRAVSDTMIDTSNSIRVYDYAKIDCQSNRIIIAQNLRELVYSSDLIFGCTGRNVFVNNDELLSRSWHEVRLISCSSRDIEFSSLLTKFGLETDSPYGTIGLAGGMGFILNGGFPINFDRTREWEEESEIALTRGLILAAIYQSLCEIRVNRRGVSNIVPLSIHSQMSIVSAWLLQNEKDSVEFRVSQDNFHDINWWKTESFTPAATR